jgi:hypothetical protein
MNEFDESTETKDGENDMVFHYQKGSFRRHEQSVYSDLATGRTAPKKGLFKVLFANKGNKITFFTMIMCAALIFVLGVLKGGAEKNSVAGISGALKAFAFDGKVYCALEFKNSDEKSKNSVEMRVEFLCVDSDGAVSDKKTVDFTFVPDSAEKVTAVFSDYDLVSVKCTVTAESEEAVFECAVKR